MKYFVRIQLYVLCFIFAFSSLAMGATSAKWQVISPPRSDIQFPDIMGYKTLKCDLHMHTVFSDGKVWPTIRIDEAWREGFDAVVISDHIEYQPFKDDIPTQYNRAYEIAAPAAAMKGILFPMGTEVTRDTPPGHFNAIFLEDVNPVADKQDNFLDEIKVANEQGAFVFWNHQGWKGSERGRWLEVHTTLYENKWLHGMEVCNGGSYYPDAHQWCLDKNLTMLGNSDIHDPSLLMGSEPGKHRTMTLVFSKDKSMESLKEALFAGRTAVWYKEQIIGKEEYLTPLFQACIEIDKPYRQNKNSYFVEIRNRSDIDFVLDFDSNEYTLPAQKTIQARIDASDVVGQLDLSFVVKNFLIAPEKGLPVEYQLEVE